jgi:pyruvate dehydrogenase E1 component beta subunit
MRREILMPPMTPSMTDGKISRWHVSEGQSVAAGDLLAEVATPTATFEIEADNEGHVERILVPAGTEGVKVNTPIAILFGGAGEGRAQTLGFAALDPLRREGKPSASARGAAPRAVSQGQTYREALRDALAAEMRADPDVFVIGVDVAQNRGAPTVTQGLVDTFGPKRVVSVPVLDEALFGMAVGAAFAGLKPVVQLDAWGRSLETLAPYLVSASQTFYLSGGRLPVPIVFRGANGFAPGMTGEGARCVAASLARIAGLKVAQPASASAARGLLAAAIRDPGPVAVLEHELLYTTAESVTADAASLGVARVVRAGADVTVVASGRAVTLALKAAHVLALEGIDAEVVDLMCVAPLDRDAIGASVAKTGRLVTVEEGVGDLGIGAEIVAFIAAQHFRALKNAPVRVAGARAPMPYAEGLQAAALPTADRIAGVVSDLVRGG